MIVHEDTESSKDVEIIQTLEFASPKNINCLEDSTSHSLAQPRIEVLSDIQVCPPSTFPLQIRSLEAHTNCSIAINISQQPLEEQNGDSIEPEQHDVLDTDFASEAVTPSSFNFNVGNPAHNLSSLDTAACLVEDRDMKTFSKNDVIGIIESITGPSLTKALKLNETIEKDKNYGIDMGFVVQKIYQKFKLIQTPADMFPIPPPIVKKSNRKKQLRHEVVSSDESLLQFTASKKIKLEKEDKKELNLIKKEDIKKKRQDLTLQKVQIRGKKSCLMKEKSYLLLELKKLDKQYKKGKLNGAELRKYVEIDDEIKDKTATIKQYNEEQKILTEEEEKLKVPKENKKNVKNILL